MIQTEKAVFRYGQQLVIPMPSTVVANLNAGDVVVLGTCVGVALEPYNTNNDPRSGLAVTGVFSFLKEPTVAFAVGDNVEWDAGNLVAIAAGGGGYTDTAFIGKCTETALAADTVVHVLMTFSGHTAAG